MAKSQPSLLSEEELEKELSQLDKLTLDDLRRYWRERFKAQAPSIRSADILRRFLAWKLQADTFGGLDKKTAEFIRAAQRAIRAGKPLPQPRSSNVPAGTVLIREWLGEIHRVLVLDDAFEHKGQRYRSLSRVAKAITGTTWSGPRFFGLPENTGARKARKDQERQDKP